MTIQPISASQRATPQMRQVAQAFEGQVLSLLLKPVFATVAAGRGAFGGGAAEETWRPMLVAEFGKVMAAAGGVGLADAVLRQMLLHQEATHAAAGGAA